MIVCVGVLRDHLWENTLVDISCGEVGLAEVRRLVRVIQLEFIGFSNLVI